MTLSLLLTLSLFLTLPLQFMLEVMNIHHGNPEIIASACELLAYLAANADNIVTIAAAGGIPVRIAFLLHPRNHNPIPPTLHYPNLP